MESSEQGNNIVGASDSPFRNFQPYQPKQGETYMSDEQLQHFRHILNRWRLDLMQEVDRTVHHMQDEAANFPDPADRATQEEEFSIELRTRDRERKLIKKIDRTIERLDQDCIKCTLVKAARVHALAIWMRARDIKGLDSAALAKSMLRRAGVEGVGGERLSP